MRYFAADTIIFAIGQAPATNFINATRVEVKEGALTDADNHLVTGAKGVFAAGEAVTGPSSIIDAIAQGRRAAISIDLFLGGQGIIDQEESEVPVSAVCGRLPEALPDASETSGIIDVSAVLSR